MTDGSCACGCGESAPIAKKTATKYGHVKGQPVRYINGHYQRASKLSPVDYLVDSATECWIWQRYIGPYGYGSMRVGKRMVAAHRVYYERHRGPVPVGKVHDHLCRNRACVNPAHLEPVTHQENILRGETIASRRAAQTACVNGHEFTEQNTIWRDDRHRTCRECQRKAVREAQGRARRRLAEQREPQVPRPRATVDYVADPDSGCWIWQRHLTLDGYGLKRFEGVKMGAHRAYYLIFMGPIPDGMELDHLCRRRACVNPDHLEPVTRKEHSRRTRERIA